MSRVRRLPSLSLALALSALPLAVQAKTVLIIDNNNPVMGQPVVSQDSLFLGGLQNQAGNTVTYSGLLLPPISGFDQVWDLRATVAISTGLQSEYLSFLQNGGNLALIGENFIFKQRDDSIVDFVALAGGGAVDHGGLGDFKETVLAPFDGPFPVHTVTFHGADAFFDFGHGKGITEPEDMGLQKGPLSVGLAFDPGTLDNALAGRLVVFLDSGIFTPEDDPNYGSPGTEALTRNLIHYLGDEPPPPPSTHGGVPEPAAWALMLFGFGAVGASLRRRRVRLA
jgi:hypothetical protein